MDKQSLHETAKRLALELPFVELCWPFGPEFDVFKIGECTRHFGEKLCPYP